MNVSLVYRKLNKFKIETQSHCQTGNISWLNPTQILCLSRFLSSVYLYMFIYMNVHTDVCTMNVASLPLPCGIFHCSFSLLWLTPSGSQSCFPYMTAIWKIGINDVLKSTLGQLRRGPSRLLWKQLPYCITFSFMEKWIEKFKASSVGLKSTFTIQSPLPNLQCKSYNQDFIQNNFYIIASYVIETLCIYIIHH